MCWRQAGLGSPRVPGDSVQGTEYFFLAMGGERTKYDGDQDSDHDCDHGARLRGLRSERLALTNGCRQFDHSTTPPLGVEGESVSIFQIRYMYRSKYSVALQA